MLNWTNAKTTLELNDLIESGCNPWAFEYPTFYQGAEKEAFEQKVLDHYRFRQIGQETPGRWLHYFRSRIREIMPYYIQLYESQALMQSIEDPFGNVDIVETFEQTSTGSHTGSTNSTSTGESQVESTSTDTATNDVEGEKTKKFHNTPQGEVDNLGDYLTEATVDLDKTLTTDNKTTTGSTTATNTGSQQDTTQGSQEGTLRHTLTKKGNQGVNTYAHDMRELRETFLNIDLMIINELKDLFLMVY